LAFLRKVSFNRAVDRIRAERTRSLYVQTHLSAEEGMDSWDGARAVEFEQHVRALLTVIEALPARQRQVFLLHRIHGMPQREIADELGISLNMVTQHFGRAMAAIILRWEPARQLMQRQRAAQP
jgi:RNA polymerase sigma-70 factor (ECF subfamily)